MPGSSSRDCARAAMKSTKNEMVEPLPRQSSGVGLPAKDPSLSI